MPPDTAETRSQAQTVARTAPPVPRRPAPPLAVDLVGGGHWSLAEARPARFSLIVFYRGLHCPICRPYLADLNRRVEGFRGRGVEPVAISTDPQDRAEETVRHWKLDRTPVGYGLPIETARSWGLYVSRAIKDTETPEFAEPGLFLVRPDGTLYAGAIQTMPFARPHFDEIEKAIDFIVEKDYPARGEA